MHYCSMFHIQKSGCLMCHFQDRLSSDKTKKIQRKCEVILCNCKQGRSKELCPGARDEEPPDQRLPHIKKVVTSNKCLLLTSILDLRKSMEPPQKDFPSLKF